jgi:hypothetical protein
MFSFSCSAACLRCQFLALQTHMQPPSSILREDASPINSVTPPTITRSLSLRASTALSGVEPGIQRRRADVWMAGSCPAMTSGRAMGQCLPTVGISRSAYPDLPRSWRADHPNPSAERLGPGTKREIVRAYHGVTRQPMEKDRQPMSGVDRRQRR